MTAHIAGFDRHYLSRQRDNRVLVNVTEYFESHDAILIQTLQAFTDLIDAIREIIARASVAR
jgi:hypothetical protein